jgi:hypothetical protein
LVGWLVGWLVGRLFNYLFSYLLVFLVISCAVGYSPIKGSLLFLKIRIVYQCGLEETYSPRPCRHYRYKQLDFRALLLSDLHTENWNSAVVGCAVALHALLNIA